MSYLGCQKCSDPRDSPAMGFPVDVLGKELPLTVGQRSVKGSSSRGCKMLWE